ncbi:hypothetical protein [Streptomyces sp. NPDC005953]|uniref:hypothetical protein n=1 Tax=Streptomyces sp. NPDC005953 TaxID=3156719 RepID=UPI0033CE7DB0
MTVSHRGGHGATGALVRTVTSWVADAADHQPARPTPMEVSVAPDIRAPRTPHHRAPNDGRRPARPTRPDGLLVFFEQWQQRSAPR